MSGASRRLRYTGHMNESEQRAVLTVCLMAAMADGAKADEEQGQIRRIAESLGDGARDVSAIYQDVLLKRVTLEQAVAPLAARESRQLANEMAVCICYADGRCNEAEREFLTRLSGALGLSQPPAAEVHECADQLAALPTEVGTAPAPGPAATLPKGAELDRMVLNYAILTGALELLPESLATMAIIPLQMKMVYRIGQHYGFELGRGHLKDFLATAGVGLTSQVLETYATKLMRGLFGAVAGGLGRMVGGQATSSAMSFATTYALGQAARRYYEGGRQFSAIQLRELFSGLLGEAKALQARYLPEIQQRSQTINPRDLLPLVTRS